MPPTERAAIPTTTFTYQRDYRFKSGSQVSVTTLKGPLVLGDEGYNQHLDLIQNGSSGGVTFGAAKLWRDPKTKKFYLLVSLTVETPDPTPETLMGIKGADLGERYWAVTTTPRNRTQFFHGGAIRHKGEAFQGCVHVFSQKALGVPGGGYANGNCERDGLRLM